MTNIQHIQKAFLVFIAILGLTIINIPVFAQQAQNSITISNQVTDTQPAGDSPVASNLVMVVVLCDSAGNPISDAIGNNEQQVLTQLTPGTYTAISYGGYSGPGGGGGSRLTEIANPLPRLLCSGQVESLQTSTIEVNESSNHTINLSGTPLLTFNGDFNRSVDIFDITSVMTPGVTRIEYNYGNLVFNFITNPTVIVSANTGPICIDDQLTQLDGSNGLDLLPGTYSFNDSTRIGNTNDFICGDYELPSQSITIQEGTTYYFTEYFYTSQDIISGLQLLANTVDNQPIAETPSTVGATGENENVGSRVSNSVPPLIRSGMSGEDLGTYYITLVFALTLIPTIIGFIRKQDTE